MRRITVAAALTVGILATVGSVGGMGYAASAAKSFAKGIDLKGSSSKASSSGNGNQNGAKAGSSASSAATPASDQYVGKTTICHHTSSAKKPFVVITVSNNALPAHKRHGDTLVGPGGSCPGPLIP
jgi:hypothetical protein